MLDVALLKKVSRFLKMFTSVKCSTLLLDVNAFSPHLWANKIGNQRNKDAECK